MSTKINLRSLSTSPSQRAAVFALIDQHFPKGHSCSRPVPVDEEFRMLLQEGNHFRVLFLEKEGKILSVCAWAPFTFDFGKSQLKCAGIGLVCSAPDERGQGYSSYLLGEAEKQARAENAALAVLWSSTPDHYFKLGYMLSGFEYQWKLSKDSVARKLPQLPKEVQPVKDFQDLLALYDQDPHGPKRDPELYNHFLKLPETFLLKTQKSYIAMGKARDLHNCVHELVGDPTDFSALLSRLMIHIDAPEFFLQLPASSNFVPEIEKLFGPGQLGGYALAKVLNGPALAEKILRSSTLAPGMDFKISEQEFSFHLREKQVFSSKDYSHFLQLFLGPLKVSDFEDLSTDQKAALSGVKVPPLYFWGFDSV